MKHRRGSASGYFGSPVQHNGIRDTVNGRRLQVSRPTKPGHHSSNSDDLVLPELPAGLTEECIHNAQYVYVRLPNGDFKQVTASAFVHHFAAGHPTDLSTSGTPSPVIPQRLLDPAGRYRARSVSDVISPAVFDPEATHPIHPATTSHSHHHSFDHITRQPADPELAFPDPSPGSWSTWAINHRPDTMCPSPATMLAGERAEGDIVGSPMEPHRLLNAEGDGLGLSIPRRVARSPIVSSSDIPPPPLHMADSHTISGSTSLSDEACSAFRAAPRPQWRGSGGRGDLEVVRAGG